MIDLYRNSLVNWSSDLGFCENCRFVSYSWNYFFLHIMHDLLARVSFGFELL